MPVTIQPVDLGEEDVKIQPVEGGGEEVVVIDEKPKPFPWWGYLLIAFGALLLLMFLSVGLLFGGMAIVS